MQAFQVETDKCVFASRVTHTEMFHVNHFGTIKRGFSSCSLTSPLAHLTFDPKRMRRIDPKDFQFLAKELQLLQGARQPRLLRMASTSAKNWVAVNSPSTM